MLETDEANAGEAQGNAKTPTAEPLRKAERWNKWGPA